MIEDLALKLKSGRSSVSLGDIHDALAEVHWAGNVCKAAATTRPGFKDAAAKVGDEHTGLFAAHDQKLIRMTKACELLDAKCGMVHEAVTHWDFKKMPWIFKGKDGADTSITSAGKLVEQFHAQFDDLKNKTTRMATHVSGGWLDGGIVEKLTGRNDAFTNGSYNMKM